MTYRVKIFFGLGMFAAAFGFLFHQLYLAGGDEPVASRTYAKPGDGKAKLLFISDTQAPLWVETLKLDEHGNQAATDDLFQLLLEEEGTDAIFHLGDLTAVGSSGRAWRSMDRWLKRLGDARINLYPIFGNHDYFMCSSTAKENFFHRFPYTYPSWYCIRQDGLAVVMLNSNFKKLTDEERNTQLEWYSPILDELEKAADIRVVIVASHHPPYTNSTVHGPSETVLEKFVPPFRAHGKCRLFLSGHSHAFEHFTVEGRHFMVIGGGGGLLHPLLSGDEQRIENRFLGEKMGFFHYLRCELHGEVLVITVIRQDGEEAYRVRIEE
jgi:predicted phosphodiesterase